VIDGLRRLRPEDVLSFFRAKGLAPPDARFDFRDVWQNGHATQFVVAKAMQTEVLEVIRAELDEALANGGTVRTFMDRLEPELKRLGWWGRGTQRDPLTGEMKNVQLGSPRRLELIFNANMRSAHAAGKWARIERVKDAFPFLRYVQIQRATKREDHALYHDLVLPVDDPAWERIYPPNGWNCGCTVQQLSQAQLDRRGLSVREGFGIEERPVLNRRTGQIEQIAKGVDPAWDGNSGKAFLDISGRHAAISDGMSAASAAIERGFAERIRLMGLGDGRERLGAFDLASGEEIDFTAGRSDRVRLSAAMRARLDAGAQVALVHNHPSSAPLSPEDMSVMFGRGVQSVMAVGHDGSLYRAQLLNTPRGRVRDVAGIVARIVDDLGLDPVARDHAVRLTVLDVLQSQGLILYEENLGPQAQAVRVRVEREVRAIAAQIVRTMNGEP
jgi:hypothetical protein